MKPVQAVDWLNLSLLGDLEISTDAMLSVYDLIACAVRLDDLGRSEESWSLLGDIGKSIEDFVTENPVHIRTLLGTAFEYINQGDETPLAFGAF